MTDVARMLEAIREELRTTVLERIEGDYERSVVIAMLGILRDLRDTVVYDETPIAAEAERLAAVCRQAVDELGEHALAVEVAGHLRSAERTVNAAGRRRELATAVEHVVRELWREPALAAHRRSLLPRLRAALKT